MAAKKDKTIIPKGKMSVDDILKSIRKDYGSEAITTFRAEDIVPCKRTSSGILALDAILGGGVPDGRIIEVYGPESSGKTTVTLHMIAESQRLGNTCAYIDAEHAFDMIYAKKLGVNLEQLLYCNPECGEQALDIADSLVRSGAVSLIVVDSVAALVPKKEIEGDMGDANVGLQARLMGQGLRKLVTPAAQTGCTIVFINQLREKVGVMFGNPETTPGGRALKFYSSIRLDVRKKGAIQDLNKNAVANRTMVKTVKNKTYIPMKFAEFDIVYGKGVDNVGSVIELALKLELIKASGSWLTYGTQRFQGRSNLHEYLCSKEGASDFHLLEDSVRQSIEQSNASMMDLSGEEKEELMASEGLDSQQSVAG